MILKEFQYHLPKTLKEAQNLLSKSPDLVISAGGTFLLTQLKKREKYPKAILSLKNIPELHGVKQNKDAMVIGATTTLDDVARNLDIKRNLPLLSEAIGYIATPQIRNMATIGGNVCSGLPWADLPAVLLALDAELIFSDKKVLQAKEFVDSPKSRIKKAILTGIKIPLAKDLKYAYVRMPRANEEDIPLVSVCLVTKESCVNVAVNFGNNFPRRMPKTEKLIKNKGLSLKVRDSLNRTFNQEVQAIEKDAYRQEMILVCFKQALEKHEES